MSAISIKQLLEAGVHFGHQTQRWNPKMKDYIFGERNGIYIIDLQKTLRAFKEAVNYVVDLAARGKTVLFVGTKAQAREAVEEAATRCGMYYVNNRWLGGMLTNFATIQMSIKRYKDLDSMKVNGHFSKVSKKEAAQLERERKKLEKNLVGIREMDKLPDAVFVVDSNHEMIAVKEANRLGIPVIAIVDTNCDPDAVDYVIPGNDDALRSVRLFADTIAEAVDAGRQVFLTKLEAKRKEADERAAKEAAARKAAKEAKEAARKAREAEEKAKAKAAEESDKSEKGKPKSESEEKAPAKSEAKAEAKTAEKSDSKTPQRKGGQKTAAKDSKPDEAKAKGEAKAKPAAKAKTDGAPKKGEKASAKTKMPADAGAGQIKAKKAAKQTADKEESESDSAQDKSKEPAKAKAES